MTQQAIKALSRNQNGFFLMVEGSQIDWAGHGNDLQYSLREMYSFDEAIKTGLDFALKDEHTLVVVTADHETGGMNITDGKIEEKELEIKWMTGSHTGGPVPIFSFGPQAYSFTGLIDNTDVAKIFAELLQLNDFPKKL
jgi:alkaline phosphatase